MFPVTITIGNIADLQKVQSVLYPTTAVAEVKEAPAKKSAPAATTTAAASSPSTAEKAAPVPTTVESTSSSAEPSTSAAPGVSFDELKKAFLSLSTKTGGRTLCEGVLKPLGLGKLSEAKPEQYAALLDAINKAAA